MFRTNFGTFIFYLFLISGFVSDVKAQEGYEVNQSDQQIKVTLTTSGIADITCQSPFGTLAITPTGINVLTTGGSTSSSFISTPNTLSTAQTCTIDLGPRGSLSGSDTEFFQPVNIPPINIPPINIPPINFPQINFPPINFPSTGSVSSVSTSNNGQVTAVSSFGNNCFPEENCFQTFSSIGKKK